MTISGIVTGQTIPTHIAMPITTQQCATSQSPRHDERALNADHSSVLKKSVGWARGATANVVSPVGR